MQHHNITITQLSVILSPGSTSKASKEEGNVFFITFTNVFFIFRIKNAFFNVFIFFPNVYYNYGYSYSCRIGL